jgi:hypothetical protein
MHDDNITQCWLFPPLFDKPVEAGFDQPQVRSDGGLILVKGFEQRMELTESLALCLHEARWPGKIHPPA